MSQAVRNYLERLEIAIKQLPGAVPQNGLDDAAEFLELERRRLVHEDPGLSDETLEAHFESTYGPPDEVAAAYAPGARPPQYDFAPNWRISCPTCGRSAPAASVGIIRLGARSWKKRTLGYCRVCQGFRWLMLTRDLNKATLTALLFGDKPASRGPWDVVAIVAVILLIAAAAIAAWCRSAFPG